MAVNKVVYGTTVLVDLTEDTVTADKLAQGYTAHDKSGALITGTATGGGDASLRELICPQQTVTPSSYEVSLEREEGFVIGGHYVVTYDGTEYLFTTGSLWGGNGICLGEQTLNYDHSARNDEIAPFLLWETFNDVTRTPKLYAKNNNSHAIKIERIDRDSVETTNICPQQTVTTNSSYIGTLSNTTAQLVAGDYYLVTYDGTEWMFTAASIYNGGDIVIGDDNVQWDHTADNNVYPFLIYNDGQGMGFQALDANASHTIKVDRITEIPDSIALTTKTITNNGTYNASSDGANGYSSVTVNVPSAGGTYQAKTNISPTTSSQTITPDSGYDALSSVQINAMPSGTEGTPSATKGTVSNHSVSVTPSVTNTTGYITGGTKTGTAVTVSASELVSGNKAITQNGNNIDVTDYATVSVNVSGGGSMNVQVAQSTSRATSSTYTKLVSLTCSKSGTYDVYWDCFRSSTGGTSGSQLYVGGSAYDTANTTFSNHAQTNHLTGVTISANQEVAVYARSRGSNYYAYCGQLAIVQTA